MSRWISCLMALLMVLHFQMQARAQALPEHAPEPADNVSTAEKIELGKQLYFDTRLSKDKSLSCNSCHDVTKNGIDGKRFSSGVGGQLGGRNAPTVFNSAFYSVQFWDGRAATLEEQAKGPMVNPVEMAMPNHDEVVARLKSVPEYVRQFDKVFGPNAVTIDNVVKAIAAFERTLITPDSAYDRFIKGDKTAMTPLQQKGWKVFQEVGCVTCHSGAHFSGPTLPIGQGFYQRFPLMPNAELEKKYGFSKDLGRYQATKKEEDKHLFRVQSLRNVALTPPYFHNGAVGDLKEAVRVMAKLQLGKDLKDDDKKAIVAFLESLTGRKPQVKPPQLPN